MGILNRLKEEKKMQFNYPRSIEAVLYPDRILVGTYCRTKAGLNVVTEKITWINAHATVEEIGKLARRHLESSQEDVENPTDFSLLWKTYKKATGFTSVKNQMKDARYIVVEETENQFNIQPTRNGGAVGKSRGYHFLMKKDIKIENTISDSQLGELMRKAWNNCE
jgi:hypothetical protein